MPWHIILPFFLFGILLGINAGKKEQRKEENSEAGDQLPKYRNS